MIFSPSNDYAEKTARLVPGVRDLHKMVGVLLAEHAPAHAQVLVLGAGGGQELLALAQMHGGWEFHGVDPSAPMLAQARAAVAPHGHRVHLHEGYLETAPQVPFDAATCL